MKMALLNLSMAACRVQILVKTQELDNLNRSEIK